ncbi:8-amino-7-oxononanoate synthase [candidate division WOR-1 bacterium RIFOXYB2_FULL_48_7]|uniref:8-amino-7-ketopelargonate synthase n=1 Tax=candidate division WOR-1 bacterium RIFOXYB2_FULL_48_7 TaxID=1802583 RepID=A0A1F4TMM9_UNCSA|nr:MAG: 8-amino-7-oxononanoate synthase [candidate division WOR-1 bacterium RIFOXYB2_FULL_48_7]
MLEFIEQELADLQARGLSRSFKSVENISGTKITINGRKLINFCSNNYLGLADDPQIKAQACAAIQAFGFGAGAARLVSGNTILHDQLEEKLARFKNRAAALTFSTGYLANLGVINTLVNENDTIIIDRLNHASIIDACRLSRAKLQVYEHLNMTSLEKILQRSAKFRQRLIVTDAVFSMDGDIAPLPEIIKLAKAYQAITLVDEAHSTGVLGETGQGIEEYFGLTGQIDIIMGTLSKALGSLGGFIAGSQKLIDYLRNKSRPFIYTTALPPSACAAALAALKLIEEDSCLVRNLKRNTTLLSPQSATPIIPVIIGQADQAVALAEKFFDRGIFLSAIRPPTVPAGSSRLRITVTAAHTKEEIACLASSLQELIPA